MNFYSRDWMEIISLLYKKKMHTWRQYIKEKILVENLIYYSFSCKYIIFHFPSIWKYFILSCVVIRMSKEFNGLPLVFVWVWWFQKIITKTFQCLVATEESKLHWHFGCSDVRQLQSYIPVILMVKGDFTEHFCCWKIA